MVHFRPLVRSQPGEFLTIHSSLGFYIAEQMCVCVCVCVCVCEPRVWQKSCELCEPGSTLGWVQVLQELVGMCAQAILEGLCQCVHVGKLTFFFLNKYY